MIIDDEKALADVIEYALRRTGFQVEIASEERRAWRNMIAPF